MTQSEIVLLFAESARRWIGRKATEPHIELAKQLNQAGYTAFLNNYTLAYHNLHYPIVVIGDAKFLKAWSLPNPIIAIPQINAAGEIDFLRRDERIQVIFLPAVQIDYLNDERVRVGNIAHPSFLDNLVSALTDEQNKLPSTATD